MEPIRAAILGYGNIGRGVEQAISAAPDMKLEAIFTRRDPKDVVTRCGTKVLPASESEAMKDAIDVLILCGGSATDLPVQGPQYAALFNTVDSFDTHAKIPDYFKVMDQTAKENGHLSVISAGWDPGLFSLARLYGESILPDGDSYTFWGRGISQGHSDAIRRIEGVQDARQYTVPIQETVDRVRGGERPTLTARQKHRRECYVVAKEGADREAIRQAIVTMPYYFDEYDTTVTFITAEEMKRDHSGMPHGGFVIRSGATADGSGHSIEYKLTLASNPYFTGSVLTACARAAVRLHREGQTGARTMIDLPPSALSQRSHEELLSSLV